MKEEDFVSIQKRKWKGKKEEDFVSIKKEKEKKKFFMEGHIIGWDGGWAKNFFMEELYFVVLSYYCRWRWIS